MFDVGFQELTLIGVIALIVVGPERLPGMARTLGLWMGRIRYYVGQVKSDIEREARAQELKEMLDKPARELDDLYKVAEETKGTLDQARDALGEAGSAFDERAAGISTPGEPTAGSIFPTELPEAGPARDASAPAQLPEASAAPAASTPEPGPATAGPEKAVSPHHPEAPAVPTPESGPATTEPEKAASPHHPEAPATPAASTPEPVPAPAGPEEAVSPQPDGAEPGRPNARRVVKDTRESHERSSERT